MKEKKKSIQNTGLLSYTQQLKQNKKVKEFWKSMGVNPDAEEIGPYARHIKLISGITNDETLEMLTNKIRMIDMLDIYEAGITATGISHLTKTEWIKEIRLKNCPEITNDAIPVFNKINGLELLYLKGTRVSIDALYGLSNLTHLKSLYLFTDIAHGEAKAALIPLRNILPQCEFIINHDTIYFDE